MNAYSAYGASSRAPRRRDGEDFRRMVEEVRQQHNISEVVGKWTKLRPAGREMVGLCLRHKERSPSMRVNDAKGKVHCFGCGYSADIFQVIGDELGLSFMDALEWIAGADLRTVDHADRMRQRADDAAARAREIADARELWTRSVEPAGTPAETYLREARGITMALPPSIRFGMVPAWRDRETGEWSKPQPAVICGIYDRAGDVVGIQRIFLRDGGRAKARMKRPKLTLGRIRGASMRLGPVRETVIVCEGPEDGLSLAQELPEHSVWPTLGTGLMPFVEYPPEVREVIVAGQNDAPGAAAAATAAASLAERGFAVRTMFPDPAFKDWNDQLRGVRI